MKACFATNMAGNTPDISLKIDISFATNTNGNHPDLWSKISGYRVSGTFLKRLGLLASHLEQMKLIDDFDPKILCWLFTGWSTVLFRAWFEASTQISSAQRSDLPTQRCHFEASQVSENSTALEATPPCSDLRCTLDMQHMINR